MFHPRKSWLAALCLGTMAMFFTQMIWHGADDAGLVSCCESDLSGHHHGPADSSVPLGDDCCSGHSGSVLLTNSAGLVMQSLFIGTVVISDDLVPDAPVRAIDHPPQLS